MTEAERALLLAVARMLAVKFPHTTYNDEERFQLQLAIEGMEAEQQAEGL